MWTGYKRIVASIREQQKAFRLSTTALNQRECRHTVGEKLPMGQFLRNAVKIVRRWS